MEENIITQNMLKRRLWLSIGIICNLVFNFYFFFITYIVKGNETFLLVIDAAINLAIIGFVIFFFIIGRKQFFFSSYRIGKIIFALPTLFFLIYSIVYLILTSVVNYEYITYGILALILYLFTFLFNIKEKNHLVKNNKCIIFGAIGVALIPVSVISMYASGLDISVFNFDRSLKYEKNDTGVAVVGTYSGISQNVVIEETYYTADITSISSGALKNIDKVTINGVLTIDSNAFENVDTLVLKTDKQEININKYLDVSNLEVNRKFIDTYRKKIGTIKFYIYPIVSNNEYYVNFNDTTEYVNTIILNKNEKIDASVLGTTTQLYTDTVEYKNDNDYYESKYNNGEKVLAYWSDSVGEVFEFNEEKNESYDIKPNYEEIKKINIKYQLGSDNDEAIYVSESRSYTLPTINDKQRIGFQDLKFKVNNSYITEVTSGLANLSQVEAVWTLKDATFTPTLNGEITDKLDTTYDYDYENNEAVSYEFEIKSNHDLDVVNEFTWYSTNGESNKLNVSKCKDSGTYYVDITTKFTEFDVTYVRNQKLYFYVTINKKDTILTADDVEAIYDKKTHTLSPTSSHPEDTSKEIVITSTDATKTDSPINVGTYNFKVSIEATDNYNAAEIQRTVTINKRNVNIEIGPFESTYGDETDVKYTNGIYTLGTNNSDEGIVYGDKVQIKYSGLENNQGSYVIDVECLNDNYKVTYQKGTYTLNKRDLTVTIDNKSQVYGDQRATLSSSITSGNIVSGDATPYTYKCDVDSKTNVGSSYVISGVCINDNYNITFINGTYEVTKRSITVEISNLTSQYGDAITTKVANVTVGTIANNDIPYTLLSNVSSTSNVGTYAITGTCTNDNYEITFVEGTYTITKRKITVTIENKTSPYGDELKAFSASVTKSRIVNGDQTPYTLSSNVTSVSNVNLYAITGTCTNDNYEITFVEGTYTITKRKITVTIENKTSQYGEKTIDLTSNVTSGSILSTDLDVYSLSCNVTSNSNVGYYDIILTVNNDKYDVTYSKAKYEITKRNINIIIGSFTSIYGDASDSKYTSGTYTLGTNESNEGILSGDKVQISYTGLEKNQGTYEIDAKSLNDNYTLTYQKGTYIVSKRKITVTIDSKSSEYGNATSALTASVTSGTIVSGDVAPYTLSTTATNKSNVGTYAITGTCTNDNYEITFVEGTYTITKRKITVTIENKTSKTGDAIKSLSATVTSGTVVNGDSLPYTLSTTATDKSTKGTYQITGTSTNDNYEITFVDGTYTITE